MRPYRCPRHGGSRPCTCAMGNIYRFVEPVLLLMLKEKRQSYGYDLCNDLPRYTLTDAQIEGAALYRTLRQLEGNHYVTSRWESDDSGPARRVYALTPAGERHLEEWGEVLGKVGEAMRRFSRRLQPKRTSDEKSG